MYKGTLISFTFDFSLETMEAGRQWNNVFKMLKEKSCQARILFLAKLSFKNEDVPRYKNKQKVWGKILVPCCLTRNT